jgi:hypothetical protein
MTTGRITFPPKPIPTHRPRRWPWVIGLMVIPVLVIAALLHLTLQLRDADRLEAFRAGIEAAKENGCRQTLQLPIRSGT